MSSSSSEDENLELLREATDSQFLDNSLYTDKPEEYNRKSENKEKLPSLRRQIDEDEQFNLFRVTPEFRKYVAKQLDGILDKKLSYIDTSEEVPKKKSKKGYVKLFRQSQVHLKVSKCNNIEHKVNETHKRVKKQPKIDYEDLKHISISPDSILTKKETKHWSNRSKAPIYNYKSTKNGTLLSID